LLILVAAVCRFSLSVGGIALAAMANWMEGSAENRQLGWMISMEMRRGASRHVIAFKTMLFLYGWIHTAEESQQESIRSLVLNDPLTAIERLWIERLGVPKYVFETQDSEWTASMGFLARHQGLDDHTIFTENENARELLAKTPIGLCDFSDFTLLDLQLGDDGSVPMPRRSAIGAYDHFNGNMEKFSAIERGLSTRPMERFHISPGDQLMQFGPAGSDWASSND